MGVGEGDEQAKNGSQNAKVGYLFNGESNPLKCFKNNKKKEKQQKTLI